MKLLHHVGIALGALLFAYSPLVLTTSHAFDLDLTDMVVGSIPGHTCALPGGVLGQADVEFTLGANVVTLTDGCALLLGGKSFDGADNFLVSDASTNNKARCEVRETSTVNDPIFKLNCTGIVISSVGSNISNVTLGVQNEFGGTLDTSFGGGVTAGQEVDGSPRHRFGRRGPGHVYTYSAFSNWCKNTDAGATAQCTPASITTLPDRPASADIQRSYTASQTTGGFQFVNRKAAQFQTGEGAKNPFLRGEFNISRMVIGETMQYGSLVAIARTADFPFEALTGCANIGEINTTNATICIPINNFDGTITNTDVTGPDAVDILQAQ